MDLFNKNGTEAGPGPVRHVWEYIVSVALLTLFTMGLFLSCVLKKKSVEEDVKDVSASTVV
jgi:hypothetical protein